jgi:S-adenosylmethionine:tRNA ribosyltransferase-isomerase
VRLELFDYELPPDRIAQIPIEPRDASRLLVLRSDGSREHRRFLDLPDYLSPGDLLVFNDTRVLPARLFGRKETGARVEILLLQRLEPGRWEALAYPGRRLSPGSRMVFEPQEAVPFPDAAPPPRARGSLTATVVGVGEEGTRILEFDAPGGPEQTDALIHELGQVPLPPYIHQRLDDPERYQTLYAREEGSAAAPTAGLHFTPRVFGALRQKGIGIAYVTLHVGIATFRPIKAEAIEEHAMHAEWYSVPEETARAIEECSGRVVAVGTTTVRCLESAALPAERHRVRAGSGLTRLYITPGAEFQVVDALVTNFHMPQEQPADPGQCLRGPGADPRRLRRGTGDGLSFPQLRGRDANRAHRVTSLPLPALGGRGNHLSWECCPGLTRQMLANWRSTRSSWWRSRRRGQTRTPTIPCCGMRRVAGSMPTSPAARSPIGARRPGAKRRWIWMIHLWSRVLWWWWRPTTPSQPDCGWVGPTTQPQRYALRMVPRRSVYHSGR